MPSDLVKRIQKSFVEKYPDLFPTLDDLPIENMGFILDEKGITEEECAYMVTEIRFKYTLEKTGVKLDGLVLDLCSGKHSIAIVYDKTKVICYDFLDSVVDVLNEKGRFIVQGNIRELVEEKKGKKRILLKDKQWLPFKDKSFDYLYCEGLPIFPNADRTTLRSATCLEGTENYIKRLTEEMVRITKKKAIIGSGPFVDYFPKKYRKRQKLIDDYTMVLDCKGDIDNEL